MASTSGQKNNRRRHRRFLRGLEIRAAMEPLEDRCVLSAPTIASVSPSANFNLALRDTAISAVFDQEIEPSTVSAQSIAVHASQTGMSPDVESTYLANGPTVTITAGKSFAAGELVQVTLTDGIQNQDGESARPFVWQFRTRAGDRGSSFFEDSGQSLGSSTTTDVALGDLDGDGDLDAFVGNLGTRRVTEANEVWINDGQGFFSDSGQDFGGIHTAAVALGDLDGDGDLDAYVGNRGFDSTHDWEDEVWLNDGSGSFMDSGQRFGQSFTTAVALGDLDGDGDLDAFAGHLTHISVWQNDGSGEFSDSGQTLNVSWTNEVALGDVDGDGDLDAFTANSSTIGGLPDHIWLNDGLAGFTDSGQELGNSVSSSVALGDLDGDGDLDAYVSNRPVYGSNPANRVWLNDGNGVFRDSGQQLGDAHSLDVQLGDVDGDGDLDAFVGNAVAIPDSLITVQRPAPNRVWLNDGTGHFTHNDQELGLTFSEAVALGDVDGDGDLDAFIGTDGVPGESVGANKVWLNADKLASDLSIRLTNDRTSAIAGQPVTYQLTVTNELPQNVNGARVHSAISSRISDVTWTCSATTGSVCSASGEDNINDTVSMLSRGQLAYTLTGMIDQSANITIISSGTVTMPAGVRDLEPTNNTATDADRILPREVTPVPNSNAAPILTKVALRHHRDVDPNSASLETLVIRGSQTGLVLGEGSTLRVEGDTIIATTSNSFHPGELVQVTATDRIENLDGQGPISPYVWSFHAATGVGSGGGTGRFRVGDQQLGGPTSDTALTGDMDSDGDVDVFIGDTLWLNDGMGQLVSTEQIMASAAVMGDLDGDGDSDVVTRKGHVLLNDGRAGFEHFVQRVGSSDQQPAVSGLLGASQMESAALGDLDSDGDLDIYLARAEFRSFVDFDETVFEGLPNQVWLNDGNGNFSDSGQELGESFSHAVALGDLDSDGDLDAYVANGLNRGRNMVDRVWLNDGRGFFIDSGQRLSEFVTADVSLGDVDGDGDLDAFLAKYEYVETPSETYNAGKPGKTPNEVWLNDGHGHFSDSGQELGNSLTQAVALADSDGDGDLDALVVNASRSAFRGFFPMDETPVPDRLWLNDGQGHFAPAEQTLTLADSSDVSWGDLDNDGDLDAVIAHSDADANSVWLNVDSNEAVWTGDATVGTQGDGRTWGNANNWTFNGKLDRLPADHAPPVNVTLTAGQTIGAIELGANRTVQSIRIQAGYTLEGDTLTVESGEITVDRHVVARVNSELRSGTGVITKRGDGTLLVFGDVCEVEVDAGTLGGAGHLKSLSTAVGSTVESHGMAGTLSVEGAASLGGTLRSHIDRDTSSLNVAGDVVILPGSTLDVKTTGTLTAGVNVKTILTGRNIDGAFSTEPNIGDHVGFGVFVTQMGQNGSAVKYNAASVDIALRQANPGDADGNGTFERDDIIQILASNKYLTGRPASWTEGDWNGDGIFNQLDLFAALRFGFVS